MNRAEQLSELADVIKTAAKRFPLGTDIDEGCRGIAEDVLKWYDEQPSSERTRYTLADAGWKSTIRRLERAESLLSAFVDNQGAAHVDAIISNARQFLTT